MRIIIYDQEDLSRARYQPAVESMGDAMHRTLGRRTIEQADFVAAIDVHPEFINIDVVKSRYSPNEITSPAMFVRERWYYLKEMMGFLDIELFAKDKFIEYFKEELQLLMKKQLELQLEKYERDAKEQASRWFNNW